MINCLKFYMKAHKKQAQLLPMVLRENIKSTANAIRHGVRQRYSVDPVVGDDRKDMTFLFEFFFLRLFYPLVVGVWDLVHCLFAFCRGEGVLLLNL